MDLVVFFWHDLLSSSQLFLCSSNVTCKRVLESLCEILNESFCSKLGYCVKLLKVFHYLYPLRFFYVLIFLNNAFFSIHLSFFLLWRLIVVMLESSISTLILECVSMQQSFAPIFCFNQELTSHLCFDKIEVELWSSFE